MASSSGEHLQLTTSRRKYLPPPPLPPALLAKKFHHAIPLSPHASPPPLLRKEFSYSVFLLEALGVDDDVAIACHEPNAIAAAPRTADNASAWRLRVWEKETFRFYSEGQIAIGTY